jgi:GT2 family glycosyltransferase
MVDSLASIVVADWNGEKYMPRCLDAVGVQTFCGYEIIVIDNATSDRSVDGLETLWPGLQLLRPEGNLGFAVANNLGACRARSPEPPGRKHTS